MTHRSTSTRTPGPPASLPGSSVRPRSTWRSRKRWRSAPGWRDGLASLLKAHMGHSTRREEQGQVVPDLLGEAPLPLPPPPRAPPRSPRGREAGRLLRTSCLRSEQGRVSQSAPLCPLPAPFWCEAGSPCGGGMTKEKNTEKPPSTIPNSSHTGDPRGLRHSPRPGGNGGSAQCPARAVPAPQRLTRGQRELPEVRAPRTGSVLPEDRWKYQRPHGQQCLMQLIRHLGDTTH